MIKFHVAVVVYSDDYRDRTIGNKARVDGIHRAPVSEAAAIIVLLIRCPSKRTIVLSPAAQALRTH